MSASPCPDRSTLIQLLLGKLPAEIAAPLEEHLLHCGQCAQVAETAAVGDDLTAALEGGTPIEDDDQLLSEVIERGKLLRSEQETVQSVAETVLVEDQDLQEHSPEPTAKFDPQDIAFLLPPEQPDEIGRLGGYRIIEVLGVGGMGVVFRAEDPRLRRLVALKAMKPAVAASKSARERFLKEAQSAAAIEHDHIVTIHQVGEDRGIPFIAMRYLQGESLQTRLEREHRLEQLEIVRLGRQIALGLAAAHEHGLIHRDIKPDNIWLDNKQGRVKIVDFGLVRLTSDDSGLTQSGMVVGTPKYMAPEQAEGQSVDHRCDLFSLGSVLYHLLTGKAPFEGPSLTATLLRVTQSDPRPLEDLCPNVNADLAALIKRLLCKDPAGRPQSATDVAQALAGIEEQFLAVGHAETHIVPAVTAPEEDAVEETAALVPKIVTDDAGRPPRRRQLSVVGWWLLGAALLAGTMLLVTKKGTVTIDIADQLADDVQIEILNGGETVAVMDKSNNWTARLTGGRYQLNIDGDNDNLFFVQGDTLTVSRFGQTLVEMEYSRTTPGATAGSATYASPSDAPPPAIAPFDAMQAKKHQEEWAKYLGVPVEYTNSIGMELRLIPPGEFLMGSSNEELETLLERDFSGRFLDLVKSARPQHLVRITRAFYCGRHEVRIVDFTRFVEATGYKTEAETSRRGGYGIGRKPDPQQPLTWRSPGFEQTESHPVVQIGSNDALTFCRWLSREEGETYRLPTEAEWEYSCRAGTSTTWSFGNQYADYENYAWYHNTGGNTTKSVSLKLPNAFGLFDMHGNAREWCSDWYGQDYFSVSPVQDPTGPSSGALRVLRGGSFHYWAWDGYSASRGVTLPLGPPGFDFGFRVVRTIDIPEAGATAVTRNPSQSPPGATAVSPRRAEGTVPSNCALQFDGVDDYVAFDERFTVDPQTPLTMEAWVRGDRDVDQTVIATRLKKLRLRHADAQGRYVHLAIVFPDNVAGRTVRIYVNGRRTLTLKRTEPYAIRENPDRVAYLAAAWLRDSIGEPFAGLIDEVRISSIPRYTEEFTPQTRFEPDEHTLALYHFDEGEGTTLTDATGNGHHGTIYGATWVRVDEHLQPLETQASR